MGRLKQFERIRDSRGFDAVYRRADTTWHTPWFVLFFRRDPSQKRVGFVAGKKVGNAVKRNRAKRLLRAHFLTHTDHLISGHYVLVAKAPLLDEEFPTVAKAFIHAFKRADAIQKSDRPLSKTSV